MLNVLKVLKEYWFAVLLAVVVAIVYFFGGPLVTKIFSHVNIYVVAFAGLIILAAAVVLGTLYDKMKKALSEQDGEKDDEKDEGNKK